MFKIILLTACLLGSKLKSQDTVKFFCEKQSAEISIITNESLLRFNSGKKSKKGIIHSVSQSHLIILTTNPKSFADRKIQQQLKLIQMHPLISDSVKQIKMLELLYPNKDTLKWNELKSLVVLNYLNYPERRKTGRMLYLTGVFTYYSYQIASLAFRKISWIVPLSVSLFSIEGGLYLLLDRKKIILSDWKILLPKYRTL